LSILLRSRFRLLILFLAGIFSSARVLAQTPDTLNAQKLEQEGKLKEAAAGGAKVVNANPKDSAAWASLGVALARLQEYGEAAQLPKSNCT